MYKLRSTLKGHEQDVKCIAVDGGNIATGSRDGTVRMWGIEDKSNTIIATSEKFINSVALDNTVVLYAGQEKIVYGTDGRVLIGHEGNVCALDCGYGLVASGSWDKTAIVWENNVSKYVLKGHEAAVWDIKLVSPTQVLTASADKTIRLWEKGKQIKQFNIHSDVVRKLVLLTDGFASCSNDGTIKFTKFTGETYKTLMGHESFVYDIKQLPNGDLVSCGEDRTVRVWGLEGIKQVITLPAISIWCCGISGEDIVVGSSDSTVRVFSTKMYASEEELQEFQKEVESSTRSSNEFDESKLAPPETLQGPGKEGQVVVVKSPQGILEAHQFTQGIWNKVGEVVNSTSNKKTEYDGKAWDYVFDVDIQDGVPPLKLPYNANENPYIAADRFIMQNDLPDSVKEEIVRFIIKNTGGVDIQTKNLQVLPIKEFQYIKTFNPDSILKGIVKFNQGFDDEKLAEVGAYLHDIDSSIGPLLSVAMEIREWSNKAPAFDILRIIVDRITDSNSIIEFIQDGLGQGPLLELLTVRAMCNAFGNQFWGKDIMGSMDVFESLMLTIDNSEFDPKHASNLATAIATLLLNYSIYALDKPEMVPSLVDYINTRFAPECCKYEEAAYRLLVAFGNLTTIEPSLANEPPAWISLVRGWFPSPRFASVFSDISLNGNIS